MYKYLIIICILFFVQLLFYPYKKYSKNTQVTINNKNINVEVALSPYKKTLGLMFRKKLDKNTGMLFIFEQEAKHTFWMANTYIPLDIIWINKDKKVVYIHENTPSCDQNGFIKSSCTTYSPIDKALYVLEVNAGYTKENNINIGDTVVFDIY